MGLNIGASTDDQQDHQQQALKVEQGRLVAKGMQRRRRERVQRKRYWSVCVGVCEQLLLSSTIGVLDRLSLRLRALPSCWSFRMKKK